MYAVDHTMEFYETIKSDEVDCYFQTQEDIHDKLSIGKGQTIGYLNR